MFNINIDLGNIVFALALLIGFVLLLITVVLDDVVGGTLDALNVDIGVGDASIAPIILGFVAMFGAGGLFGTSVLGMKSGPAAIVGVAFGAAGALIVYGMFNMLARGQSQEAYSNDDMKGTVGRVVVGIPKGKYGEIVISFAGSTLKKTATADEEIRSGTSVKVVGVAGSVLIVAPDGATSDASRN